MHLSIVALALVTLSSHAFADPWKLPKPGAVIARVVVESSLTRHRMMEPVSVAPDLVVGMRAKLALALHHSRMFVGRPGAGNGLCLVGARETLGSASPDCGSGYRGPGVSLLYAVNSSLTARAGVDAGDIRPMKLALDAGAILRARSDRWWLTFAPTLFSGITNREAGNRDRLSAPLYLGADIGRGEVHVRTGFDSTLETVADTVSVQLGAGGSITPGRGLRIGGDVTLDRALGMLNAMSWRSASIYVELDHGGGS
jgi:hypothetical protein